MKRYSSEKTATEDGSLWNMKVNHKPNNPDFEKIELTCEDEGSVQVVAKLIEVLG